MEIIKIEIHWEDENYCCGWGDENFGAVICTHKTLEGLKETFSSSLKEQVDDMAASGEYLPHWLVTGDYKIEYTLAVSALLRQAEKFNKQLKQAW